MVRRERSGGTAPEAPAPLCAFLRQLLHKQGHSSGALPLVNTTRSELKFRWQVSPGLLRPCMTAQIWRPSQPGHLSNGSWVTVDSSGGVYLTCLHPQCLQRGYCNRRLMGCIPLSLLSLCSSDDSGDVAVAADRGDGCSLDSDVGVGGHDRRGGAGVQSKTCRNSRGEDEGMDSEILPTTDSTLSKRSAIRTRQETDGQGRRSSTENRQSLDPEPPVVPPVQDHSQAPFRKPQSEGLEQTPSQAPRKRRHKKLSRAQSLVQVAIENQRERQVPFGPGRWKPASGGVEFLVLQGPWQKIPSLARSPTEHQSLRRGQPRCRPG